jgi:HlyD family secretion protein
MDVARPAAVKRNKKIKQAVIVAIVLIGATAVTYGLSRMSPAAPTVDGATVWPDTVKRGEMLRQVRGLGTLVPEQIRFVTALSDGVIEEVKVRAGDDVRPDTVILVMSNPDVRQRAMDAELAVKGSEADLANLRATLQAQILNQQVNQATIEANLIREKPQFDADSELFKEGLTSELNLKRSKARVDELTAQLEMEKKRVANNERSAAAQIEASQARLDQQRTLYQQRLRQVEELNVRAGTIGQVQQVPQGIESGTRVAPGTTLARIAQPGRLKAELQIAETQVKDIVVGQLASIDTRNGIIPGQVTRIDPASINGTVKVDVQLNGELPRGARPDLSVDGTIEVERLTDVMYMGRPAYGQAESTITVFKVTPTGEALRTQVLLGRSSVNTIEVKDGLQVGDMVILSDMSAWDSFDRIRVTNLPNLPRQ